MPRIIEPKGARQWKYLYRASTVTVTLSIFCRVPSEAWQPLDEARHKDALERHACIQVCRLHAISLATAQAWFLGDWRVAYAREIGR